nr:MAG TPA: hypothetical protein [Caudoviricetes sp.]
MRWISGYLKQDETMLRGISGSLKLVFRLGCC